MGHLAAILHDLIESDVQAGPSHIDQNEKLEIFCPFDKIQSAPLVVDNSDAIKASIAPLVPSSAIS
jgi:hypothetical protein